MAYAYMYTSAHTNAHDHKVLLLNIPIHGTLVTCTAQSEVAESSATTDAACHCRSVHLTTTFTERKSH